MVWVAGRRGSGRAAEVVTGAVVTGTAERGVAVMGRVAGMGASRMALLLLSVVPPF